MKKIAIISSSVRTGRLSHRVALFLKNYIAERSGFETEILDLKEYDFPLFHERLRYMENPTAEVLDYQKRFKESDGIMIVSPVYNASYPAALKNVIDLLYPEWYKKPVSVVSVTYGGVPGIATVQQLQALLLKINARVAFPLYTVINAGTDFSEDGKANNFETANKFAAPAIDELIWLIKESSKDDNGEVKK